jgi:NNP family nitrate/nitrite transporter-like MFS transporter
MTAATEGDKPTSMLFGKEVITDMQGKGMNIKLHSFARPHMRAFHLSWFGFFLAFTTWFAFAPLMPTVKEDLGLTKAEIGNANIASIASTIIFRFICGPLCDRFGARRVFAIMLVIGSIPGLFVGLIEDANGVIITRAFIGIIGSVFVPCQMWTTYMFSPSIVGTANAMAGGWGNLGGGFTYIFMPAVFSMFIGAGLSASVAWRVSFVVPAVLCFCCAAAMWFAADDAPPPASSSAHDGSIFTSVAVEEVHADQMAKITAELAEDDRPFNLVTDILADPAVWILMFVYGLCFGVELAVNNQIGLYFYDGFLRDGCDPTSPLVTDGCRVLTQQTAGLIASCFGLMNLFARGIGGYTSDRMNTTFGIAGRILVLTLTLSFQCVFLFVFQMQRTIPTALVCLICFSTCVQMAEGATYGVVPYVNKRCTGTIAGIVGAGGNIGGVTCATIFKTMATPTEAFQIIGAGVGAAALSCLLLKVNGAWAIHVFTKGKIAQKPDSTTLQAMNPQASNDRLKVGL